MLFKTLQTGSIGNCYLLISKEGESLIIEAGIPLDKIILNIDVMKIAGAIISHSHQDHAKHAKDLLKYDIQCFMPFSKKEENIYKERIGSFNITALPVVHDVKNYAFVVDNEELGRALYITDTKRFDYYVKEVDTLIIECNYIKEIAENNILNDKLNIDVFKRTLDNHLSIDKCIELIVRHKPTNTILIHLSSKNINEKTILYKIKNIINYTNVYIAKSGQEINITKY